MARGHTLGKFTGSAGLLGHPLSPPSKPTRAIGCRAQALSVWCLCGKLRPALLTRDQPSVALPGPSLVVTCPVVPG
ncbi:unnamed protein product [Gadus morhua 'NCC']